MKPNFRTLALFIALLAITGISAAQATGNSGPEFVFRTSLPFDNSSDIKTVNMTVHGNDYYATGPITGTSISNGLTQSFNGIAKFQNGDASNPTALPGLASLSSGDAVTSLAFQGNSMYYAGLYGGETRVYKYDLATETSTLVSVTADTTITNMYTINNSLLLLIGYMKFVNGVEVNGICTLNTITGEVLKVDDGFGTNNTPGRIYCSEDGKVYIAGRAGATRYDLNTQTFTNLSNGLEMNACYALIGHGDTVYAAGPNSLGDCIYRKIGSADWSLIASVHNGGFGIRSIAMMGDKVAIVTMSGFDGLTLADNTTMMGKSLVFNESTNNVEQSPIGGLDIGMTNLLEVAPNNYIGWSMGGIFTPTSLVSGIQNLSSTKITMYPNPAKNFISIDGVPQGENIVITDLLGRTELIASSIGTKTTINTQTLSTGLHFVNGHKLNIQ
jgi:hypothetical protein